VNDFLSGFADELTKEAKYGLSRALTSSASLGGAAPAYAGSGVAGVQAMRLALGGAPSLIPIVAGSGAVGANTLRQTLMRSVSGRALHGRLVKGGKGLMAHEKAKIGEALGVSGPKLDKMIASYAAANKGGKTHALARAVSSKRTGVAIPRRLMDTRAMAGRVAAGGAGMTARENKILTELASHGKKIDSRRKLKIMAGGTAAAIGMKD
jgi:hypothetical protein